MMKIALIVPDKFDDIDFLTTILDDIVCDEIISGSSKGYQLLEHYLATSNRNIVISKADKGSTPPQRAYNAIDASAQVVILTHPKGIKTKKAIEYAKKQLKPLNLHNVEIM